MRDISKLNWIFKTSDTSYDMILDHHALSSWRQCPSNFELQHILGRRPKGDYPWSLEFGILMHEVVQRIYTYKYEGSLTLEKLTGEASMLWDLANLDRFNAHRTYKALGGKVGFIALCHQYVQYYTTDMEHLLIIGTEIPFGKKKEVPLGVFNFPSSAYPAITVNCFLSGRIDFLADDGHKIGPVDHKTRAFFYRTDLAGEYSPHEGMSGYIYATRHLVQNNFPGRMTDERRFNTAWMNFIQVASEFDPKKRFRRELVMRTDWQLEQWRLRQLVTMQQIFTHLYEELPATWNTEVCSHWYGHDCIFKQVHRLPDEQSQLIVLDADFTKDDFWNPEEMINGTPVSGDQSVNTTTVP